MARTTSTKIKNIPLHPGDRQTRTIMREAHDSGRHGDGTALDVLAYWASICCDCNATWRYEVASATKL